MDYKDMLLLQLIQGGGYSLKELKDAINVSSYGTISYRLKQLEIAGIIQQPKRGMARSRKLTETGEQMLREMKGMN